MQAFLDFLEDKKSDSHLTKRLQKEVENARSQEEWRHEYMTLAERDEEKREEGRKEGRQEGRQEERIRLVKENYADGAAIPAIAKFMKISEEEVRKILEMN